jgi:REP element-mobilizing transposase RayT
MKNYHHKLYPDHYYHIFNRANGNENLFLRKANYSFFMKQYLKFIDPIGETICYCLMPNHFHFIVRIKGDLELKYYIEKASKKNNSLENILSQQFSHCFNSYSQAFNKQEKRKGSLFMKCFNRILINDENYLRTLILYIHRNPVESGFREEVNQWEFSSYPSLSKNRHNPFYSQRSVDLFEDLENFIYCHNKPF